MPCRLLALFVKLGDQVVETGIQGCAFTGSGEGGDTFFVCRGRKLLDVADKREKRFRHSRQQKTNGEKEQQ